MILQKSADPIYGLQIVFRWLLPWLLKKYIERNMPKDDDSNRNRKQQSKKDKIIPDDKGEYVDYEEVEDKKNQDSD